ncbi:MAG: phosphotransferase [Rickettsiales bacterium]|nr:phosphotransferase [Rickettsiales bacterium]
MGLVDFGARCALGRLFPTYKLGKYISRGVFSRVWQVGRHIVRIKPIWRGTYRREARICAEIRRRLPARLRDKVPALLAFNTGLFSVSIHLGIPGQTFDMTRFLALDPARRHRFARELSVFLFDVHRGGAITRPIFRLRLARRIRLFRFAKKYGATLRRFARMVRAGGRDATGVVHGDLHPGQIIVDDDFRLAGVIDWDGARLGRGETDLRRLENPLREMLLGDWPIDRDAFNYYRLMVLRRQFKRIRARILASGITRGRKAIENSPGIKAIEDEVRAMFR